MIKKTLQFPGRKLAVLLILPLVLGGCVTGSGLSEPKTGGSEDAASFEALLRDDPWNRRIYDVYAQTLIGQRDFDEAIEVYQRALQRGDRLEDDGGVSPQEAIEEVRSLRKFSEAMKKEPFWEQAGTFSFDGGEVTTNIPQEYREPLVRDLGVLRAEEKALLEEILGPPKGPAPFLKISVAGRPEEYKALWKEKNFPANQLSPGAYSMGKNEIVIFFTGADIRWTFVHELAHCFLRSYEEQPSLFLDEGLANYLAFKFGKAGARAVVGEILGRLRGLREEGKLKNALDLFPSWKRYEESSIADEKMEFYLRAWSLIAFFLDGGNTSFTKFFRDYAQYELQMGPLSRKDTETYFRANLSQAKTGELDGAWGLFIEKMNYDSI